MLWKHRKAQVPVLLLLIVFVVAVIPIALIFFGFSWFLTKNIFVILGAFLAIAGALGFFFRMPVNASFWLIGIGIALLLLPTLFKQLGNITLAGVLI